MIPCITVIAIAAVTVTHHVSGFALAALLGVWWLIDRLTSRSEKTPILGSMALAAASITLAWFLFVARSAVSYLFDQNILPTLTELKSLLSGSAPARHLYSGGGGAPPVWWILLGFAAVMLLLVALPSGPLSSLVP